MATRFPIYISPLYIQLLGKLMEESQCGGEEIGNPGEWLNDFKNKMNVLAEMAGKTCEEMYPSYADFIREEIRLVKKGMGQ